MATVSQISWCTVASSSSCLLPWCMHWCRCTLSELSIPPSFLRETPLIPVWPFSCASVISNTLVTLVTLLLHACPFPICSYTAERPKDLASTPCPKLCHAAPGCYIVSLDLALSPSKSSLKLSWWVLLVQRRDRYILSKTKILTETLVLICWQLPSAYYLANYMPQGTLNREIYENTNGYVPRKHRLKTRTVKIETEEMKKVQGQNGYNGGCVKTMNLVRKTNILKGH